MWFITSEDIFEEKSMNTICMVCISLTVHYVSFVNDIPTYVKDCGKYTKQCEWNVTLTDIFTSTFSLCLTLDIYMGKWNFPVGKFAFF